VQHTLAREGAIWDTDEIFRQEGVVVRYHQITPAERYTLATLRKQTPSLTSKEIARLMERDRSTIYREIRRNSTHRDGSYRPFRAQEAANGRRRRTRKHSQFTDEQWSVVETLLRVDLSPEQVSGWLARHRLFRISHETIYQHIWHNKREGGDLWRRLRQRPRYRKRYGTYEKRGRLAGKRHISQRPATVELRREIGHWEMDTVSGARTKHCIVTLVERATGCLLIAKLADHTKAELNRRVIQLIREQRHLFKSITVDNGTEFHGYEDIERATGVTFYFATPYRSWERGTNENTNGLVRQYLPKRHSMKNLTQSRCSEIACILNNRPRKRYGFRTPLEQLQQLTSTRAPGNSFTRRVRVSSAHVSVAVQT
jgi:IS30 family transposase